MDEVETRIDGIKAYIQDLFGKEDEALTLARKNCELAGFPQIHVPPHVGKLLSILTKLKKPKRVLEIGTLGGYSTLWIGKALTSDAKMISIDLEEHHLQVATRNVQLAGLEEKITLLKGNAVLLLQEMIQNEVEKFDLVFIDADKENYHRYLQLIKKLMNQEALILSDNLIPKWKPIGKPHPKDLMAKSIYAFNEELAGDPSLDSAICSTIVGEISRIDGLGISIYQP